MAVAEKAGRENGRETRRRLLHAGSELVAHAGVSAVTISAVAEKAGITRRAAYHHFASREELLFELRKALNAQLLKSLRGVQDYGEPRELLVALAEQDDSALRFQVFELLNHGLGRSVLFKNISTQLAERQRAGLIKAEVDVEMFALISMSAAFLGAALAMTLAKTKKERHVIAERFSAELERTIRHGGYVSPDRQP